MRQGERRGTEVDLYDFTYDGMVNDVHLSGGLGQLTDGAEGQSNFRLDPEGLGIKGYEWIGWKNESFDPVELVFKFDRPRNFSSIRIHCNNFFSKDVRVFRKARIYFSVGGKYYTSEPLEFQYLRDTLMEYARYAIISVPHLVGQYVKMHLYFDAKWMMISEVQFTSEPVLGAVPTEVPPPTSPPLPSASTMRRPSKKPTPFPEFVEIIGVSDEEGHNQSFHKNMKQLEDAVYGNGPVRVGLDPPQTNQEPQESISSESRICLSEFSFPVITSCLVPS